ncbi:tagaturonate reductase [Pelomonas sp. SE-A7]|uniref:tagaturonate reductase n=1 Tax=Pelomonas sp. SE-A7 TaxID=3054953 RepID=UPI00259D16F6|nr:tagaturonate reductase [Pelomonas sp. SE-A7]MDM4765291.1 tagaturonate reductase [Pelomonas sp. SE-A7]
MSGLAIKLLQFGQGVFLRGFVEDFVQQLNERQGLEAGIVIVRPTSRSKAPLMDAPYQLLLRGLDDKGQAVKVWRRIDCVQRELDLARHWQDFVDLAGEPLLRFIVSNTTEAGITVNDSDRFEDAPPASFPAKLCRWLFERYSRGGAGLYLLPCELIEANGPALKGAVLHFARLWSLDRGFENWLDQDCHFCSTLVDRIVSGAPSDDERGPLEAELGGADPFMVCAEPFHSWLIEGAPALAEELKLTGSGLNIELVADLRPYRHRKVGLLNGGHTLLVPLALLLGHETVGDAMDDADLRAFVEAALAEEIIPALPLPADRLAPFAAATLRRFRNPYVKHRLASIALNSWSKFATRLLPQLLSTQARNGTPPPRLVLALAATMRLYRDPMIELSDAPEHLDWFRQHREESWQDLARGWLANRGLWGQDLNELPGLAESLTQGLLQLDEVGTRQALTMIAARP